MFYLTAFVMASIASLEGQDSFASSADLLNEGNIQEALNSMNAMVAEGKISKELYSNLGYAYLQEEDLANAMLYYQKALKLDPTNNDIQQSIVTVEELLENRIPEIPDFILVTGYRDIVQRFSAQTWSILQILGLAGVLLSLFFYLFPREGLSTSLMKRVGIASLVCALLCSVFAYSKKSMEQSSSTAIVMQAGTNIHVSPDEISPTVAPVSSGNFVYILSEIGDWYKVSLRDKDIGWIKKEEVAII